MTQQTAKMCCPRCNGCGAVQLPRTDQWTLNLVKRYPSHNGEELAELAKVKHTAMCNRLIRLERFGLVTGDWVNGRTRCWKVSTSRKDNSDDH